MKKKTEVVKPTAPKAVKLFTFTIETGGELKKVETDSLQEVLLSFDGKFVTTPTRVTVKAKGVDREFTRSFRVVEARRLFNNKLAALLFERQVRRALNVV